MDFLADPASHGGGPVTRIDTHAAAVFLAGDAGAEDQARGALSVPRLFHTRQAQRRLRGRARGQPAVRAGDLSPRGGDHARGGRQPGARRQRRAGGMGGGDGPLRRERDARSSGRRRPHRCARLADALGRAVAQAHDVAQAAEGFGFADVLAEIIAQNTAELRARAGTVSGGASGGAGQGDARGVRPRACVAGGARARRPGARAATAICISATSS